MITNAKEDKIIYYCELFECGKYFKTEKDRQVLSILESRTIISFIKDKD